VTLAEVTLAEVALADLDTIRGEFGALRLAVQAIRKRAMNPEKSSLTLTHSRPIVTTGVIAYMWVIPHPLSLIDTSGRYV